ncbi:unnamed protein product [Camellia sinensis]
MLTRKSFSTTKKTRKSPTLLPPKSTVNPPRKGYVGIHSSGFRDFLLKPELLWAIVDSGFEHPSEEESFARCLISRICHEFERFNTYLPDIKVAIFYGGVSIKIHKDLLKNECPHIVVGTPGRILALAREKDLSLRNVRHFILDECDKMLESLDMRRDVQEIFKMTPHDKQVMMFSATLSKEIRPVCKKFMQDPMEIYVDDEHYIKLSELEKNCKLNDLLDALDFNQVVIFVKSVSRAAELNKLLVAMKHRLTRYKGFKEGHKRILVATDLVGRGIDIERVNIVINYDMPDSADTYLHRVGRAGRFGTKGLAITFVSSASDSDVLNQVQERFEVDIKELPEQIDTSTYRALLNLFLIICIASFGVDSFPTSTFDVMQYGAAGDGHRDDTKAFVKAWKATCGASGGTLTLNVPSGKTFLLNPLAFEGPCKSPNVQIQWTLIAPGVDGLNIHGNGHINDQGSAWWGKSSYIDDYSDSDSHSHSHSHLDSNNYKAKSSCDRPMALRFHKCNRFELRSMLS